MFLHTQWIKFIFLLPHLQNLALSNHPWRGFHHPAVDTHLPERSPGHPKQFIPGKCNMTLSASLQLLLEFLKSKWLPHYLYLDCGNGGIIYISSSRELLFLFICSPSSVRDVTVGGSRVSSYGTCWWKLPSSTSCRNRPSGSYGVYPCVDMSGGIVPVIQDVKRESY